tara:strand:- start:1653 stop:2483 length:831 start_codon:yes stop_codon:yes gene_type:complete
MIGILGQGFVGNAIFEKFKSFYNVFTYDLDESKSNSYKNNVINQKFVFICLPTPMNKDGSCNVEIVENELNFINENNLKNKQHTIIVLKSTVSPGTTNRLNKKYKTLNIIFNPEFLTEANAIDDFNNQNRIILGGSRPSIKKLKNFYSKVFPKANIVITDPIHAEMVKYMINSFLAVKVTFANEIYQICKKLNLDYDKIVEYAILDERLGKSHWKVPGPDSDFGFGGHCLPKDLSAIINLSDNLNTINHLLHSVKKTNDKLRSNRDWEDMKGRAVV